MAGTIIHLLAARAWVGERAELLSCPEFYLGAISPDAIHIRTGAGKAEKLHTHLGTHGKLAMKPLAAYARAHNSAFDLCHLEHLLADPFWVTTYKKMSGLLKEDGRTNPKIYYPEMERTERALSYEQLFDLLQSARAPRDHPLLTEGEITAWRDRMIAHYRAIPDDGMQSRIITVPFIEAFVARAGAYLSDMMRRLVL